MKTENASSAATSAATSNSGPGNNTSPNKTDAALSDADFLARQAEQAVAALKKSWADVSAQLAAGSNPIKWAGQYPWIAMGVSAVAGFVTTALLVPSQEERALRKLAKIERALNLHAEPRRRDPEAAKDGDPKPEKPGGGSLSGFLVRELIGTLRPAIVSLLTAGVTAAAARPSEEEMQAAAAKEDAEQAGGAAGG